MFLLTSRPSSLGRGDAKSSVPCMSSHQHPNLRRSSVWHAIPRLIKHREGFNSRLISRSFPVLGMRLLRTPLYPSTAGPTTDNIPCPWWPWIRSCRCNHSWFESCVPRCTAYGQSDLDIICSKIADTSAKLCELCGLLCGEQLTSMVRMSAGKTGGYEATTQLVYLGEAGPLGQARATTGTGGGATKLAGK